jgi:hypothetical protein
MKVPTSKIHQGQRLKPFKQSECTGAAFILAPSMFAAIASKFLGNGG